jgi:hypothetical protein
MYFLVFARKRSKKHLTALGWLHMEVLVAVWVIGTASETREAGIQGHF